MKGYPQGGVLSPLLWNIVLDTLIDHLNNNGFYTIASADDIVITIDREIETDKKIKLSGISYAKRCPLVTCPPSWERQDGR